VASVASSTRAVRTTPGFNAFCFEPAVVRDVATTVKAAQRVVVDEVVVASVLDAHGPRDFGRGRERGSQ